MDFDNVKGVNNPPPPPPANQGPKAQENTGLRGLRLTGGRHVPSSQISLLKSARIQGWGLWTVRRGRITEMDQEYVRSFVNSVLKMYGCVMVLNLDGKS